MQPTLPIRAVAWSVGGWLGGALVLLLLQGALLLVWHGTEAKAGAEATATVRNLFGGESVGSVGSIDLVWTDGDGQQRSVEFDVATQQGWSAGQPFTLRYDPTVGPDDDQFVLPTGPSADRVAGPGPTRWLWIPAAVCLVIAGASFAGWRHRRARAQAALTGTPEPVRVVPLLERRFPTSQRPDHLAVALLPPDAPEPDGAWLTPADLPAGTRVQRVAWTPSAGGLPTGGVPGQAWTTGGGSPRVVVVPEGRPALLPLGGVRTIQPPGGRTSRYRHSRPHAASAEQAPPKALWAAIAAGVVVGVVRGSGLAENPGSTEGAGTLLLVVLLTAIGMVGLLLQDWGWRGGLPRTLPRF